MLGVDGMGGVTGAGAGRGTGLGAAILRTSWGALCSWGFVLPKRNPSSAGPALTAELPRAVVSCCSTQQLFQDAPMPQHRHQVLLTPVLLQAAAAIAVRCTAAGSRCRCPGRPQLGLLLPSRSPAMAPNVLASRLRRSWCCGDTACSWLLILTDDCSVPALPPAAPACHGTSARGRLKHPRKVTCRQEHRMGAATSIGRFNSLLPDAYAITSPPPTNPQMHAIVLPQSKSLGVSQCRSPRAPWAASWACKCAMSCPAPGHRHQSSAFWWLQMAQWWRHIPSLIDPV